MGDHVFGGTLGANLPFGLAKGERFSLGKDVGAKYVVMIAEWVEAPRETYEVERHDGGALME